GRACFASERAGRSRPGVIDPGGSPLIPLGVRIPALLLLALAGALSAPAPIAFVDRTAAAGLAFRSTYGGAETSTYILETTGTGVAFLDYDRDGRLDVFFAYGTTLEGFPEGTAPRCALY